MPYRVPWRELMTRVRRIGLNRQVVVFNYGLKLAVSVMELPIVIEAGLFVPE